MTTMIERVARAISLDSCGDADSASQNVSAAECAIEAMREPTDAMMRQMEIAGGAGMRGVWWVGIDAALLEQQP